MLVRRLFRFVMVTWVWCLIGLDPIGAEQPLAGDWLITPEEAALDPAPLLKGTPIEVGREDLSTGPVIAWSSHSMAVVGRCRSTCW